LSYVTVTGEGKIKRVRVEHEEYNWKHFSPLLILTQSGAFWYTDFHTALYFLFIKGTIKYWQCRHTPKPARYFYSLNVIISHLIIYKEGLGYLSVFAIASLSSPPSHVCICNGHPSSELFCVHSSHLVR
jgi:hypothetical protein